MYTVNFKESQCTLEANHPTIIYAPDYSTALDLYEEMCGPSYVVMQVLIKGLVRWILHKTAIQICNFIQ